MCPSTPSTNVSCRWRHGIGSNQIGAATALALAIASNRVLLFATPAEGWLHSEGCNVDGAECFFQPISHCKLPANFNSLNVTAADQTLDYIPPSSARYILLRAGRPHMVPMRRNMPAIVRSARAKLRLPTLLPARKRAHLPLAYASVRAWHTQATLYLMRLNLHMQGLTRVGLARCSGLGGGRVGFLAAARTAGVPLRVTDKCRRPGAGEMRCVRAEEVADALAQVRSSHPWVDTVLVTSESREFAASVAHVLEGGWRVRRNPGDVQQGSGSAGKFGREAEGRRVAGYEVTRSILVTLACQAMPRYHVLTMKSNFHSLIDMMAKVVPGKTSHFSYNIGDVANPW